MTSTESQDREPTAGSSRPTRLPGWRSWSTWRWAVPAIAVVYLASLLTNIRPLMARSMLDADAVSADVIGWTFGHPGGGHVIAGTYGWYSTLLFELASRWLPLHRQIWELGPFVFSLLGIAVVGWCVRRVAGMWAGALTAGVLVCASPLMLQWLISGTEHSAAWVCVALLGWFALELSEQRVGTVGLAGLAVAVGVIVGLNLSDLLVMVGGVAPFVICLAATQVPWRGRRPPAAVGIATLTVIVILIASKLTTSVMAGMGVTTCHCEPTNVFLAVGSGAHNADLWWSSLAALGNGNFFGHVAGVKTLIELAAGITTLIGFAVLCRNGWTAGTATLASTGDQLKPAERARRVVLLYWISSGLLTTAVFILSALPVNVAASRYLVGVIYSIAAVAAIAAAGQRRREMAAVAGAGIIALSGLISVVDGAATASRSPVLATSALPGFIKQVAAIYQVRLGFAGYWNAAPATWASKMAVRVYPVSPCGAALCRFNDHTNSTWYTPVSGARSFLLLDPTAIDVHAAPAGLGKPLAVFSQPPYTAYIYRYDIASKIIAKIPRPPHR